MAITLPMVNPNETNRYPVTYFNSESVTTTTSTDIINTRNITGCVVWFQATSVIGTPDITLTVETSKDQVLTNFVQVNSSSDPALPVNITNETPNIISINFSDIHEFMRFTFTLGGGDPGDDIVTMEVDFLYGDFTHPLAVSLEASDIQIGAVEIKNATTDDRAEVDTSGRLSTKDIGLGGASTDGTTQLTPANTWVQVPTTAPTTPYVLAVSKENEVGVIRWSFDNGGVPSTTNGNLFSTNDLIVNLQGSGVIYFGSTDAGDDVNWTTKVI